MNVENKISVPASNAVTSEVHQGSLVPPEVALTIVADESMREHVVQEQPWFLIGDSPKGMRQKVWEGSSTLVRAWVRGEKAARYLVIAHQAAAMQHRFVLPLYEPKVKTFIASCLLQPCWFSLGDSGDVQSVVMPMQLPQTLCIEVMTQLQELTDEQRKSALIALRHDVRQFAEIDSFPSLTEGVELERVSVSYVPPTQALVRELGDLLASAMVRH